MTNKAHKYLCKWRVKPVIILEQVTNYYCPTSKLSRKLNLNCYVTTNMCSPRLQFVGLIFSSQPGTTALRPSVPSQERDRTSVMIQHTHIPQDEWSRAGAATSSGLSQGRASWMWLQSRGKQREGLLDAVIVESAEVKPESEEKYWKKCDPFGVWHIPGW